MPITAALAIAAAVIAGCVIAMFLTRDVMEWRWWPPAWRLRDEWRNR